jgi:hypothetical protein
VQPLVRDAIGIEHEADDLTRGAGALGRLAHGVAEPAWQHDPCQEQTKRLVRQLRTLGHHVILEPVAA